MRLGRAEDAVETAFAHHDRRVAGRGRRRKPQRIRRGRSARSMRYAAPAPRLRHDASPRPWHPSLAARGAFPVVATRGSLVPRRTSAKDEGDPGDGHDRAQAARDDFAARVRTSPDPARRDPDCNARTVKHRCRQHKARAEPEGSRARCRGQSRGTARRSRQSWRRPEGRCGRPWRRQAPRSPRKRESSARPWGERRQQAQARSPRP